MSFFDEGDEPTRAHTRAARPRRPATEARGPAPPDRQTARTRQAVGLGALIILAILIVLGFKGCLDSRKDNALKDYNRNVTAVADDSDNTVGKQFFARMSAGARNTQDLQVQVNQLRLAAEDDVKRAKSFSVPGDMKAVQRNLELVLNLRVEGLSKIGDQIPSALGRGQASQAAIDKIAAEMQSFVASDVVYQSRVTPLITDALKKNSIGGQTIASSQFMRDVTWLAPQKIASALGRSAATSGTGTTGKPAPGLHGHSLDSDAIGAVVLQPEAPGVTNHVSAGSNPAVTVKFTNGGGFDENNVKVSINLRGGGKNITQTKTISQTTKGQQSTVNIPLGQPPIGAATTLTVSIAKVGGETKIDNNRSTYTIIWSK